MSSILASFAAKAAQFQTVRVSTMYWLRESKANARGLAPVSLRITIEGARIECSMGIRVAVPVRDENGGIIKPGGWDEKQGIVRGKSQLATMQNSQLDLFKAHIAELVNLMKANGVPVSAHTLKQHLKAPASKPLDFIELCQGQIESFYAQGNPHTRAQKEQAVQAVIRWNGRDKAGKPLPLLVVDFTPDKVSQLYQWLLLEQKVSVSTANAHVGSLSTLFECAVKMDKAGGMPNPFRLLRRKPQQAAQRTRLTTEQLASLREVELTGRPALARDVYLAQYYLHGSRVGVIMKLRWRDVREGRVNFKAEKNGPRKSIEITPVLAQVLARYRPANPDPESLLFPVMLPNYHDLPQKQQVREYNRGLMLLNAGLKVAARAADIPGNLHTHTARHTLALHAAEAVGLAAAQAMLGHASQKQTEVYVGGIRNSALEAAEKALYGAAPGAPEPDETKGGKVLPMWKGGAAA